MLGGGIILLILGGLGLWIGNEGGKPTLEKVGYWTCIAGLGLIVLWALLSLVVVN